MRVQEVIKELKLNGLSVFNVNDVSRITGKGKNYLYLLLSKSRLVARAQNGVYYLPDTDPMEVASYIATPSYISLISAFGYYKLIDQIPNVVKVITTKRHGEMEKVQGTRIVFKTTKREMLYGYHREHNISIADIEKAVVDSIYFNEDIRYIKEVIKNGIKAGIFDLGKLEVYAKTSRSKSLLEKVNGVLRVVK